MVPSFLVGQILTYLLSQLDQKCETFVSWLKDPEGFAVDAFTLNLVPIEFLCISAFCFNFESFAKNH